MGTGVHKRLGRLLLAVGLLTGALAVSAAPVSAIPRDAAGSHKITICHVTNSARNPFVVLTVDVAAFDGEGKNDHTHHVSKDGRVDLPWINGVCGGTDPNPEE